MKLNRRILILGPTAPSIGGITTAVNALMSSRLPKEFEIYLLSNSNHRPMNKKGIVDAHNIVSALVILLRLVRAVHSLKPSVVQVETAGSIGFFKQSMYILMVRMMQCKVIVSLHCANAAAPLPAKVLRFRFDIATILKHEQSLYPIEERLSDYP